MNQTLPDARLASILKGDIAIGDLRNDEERILSKMVWVTKQHGWFTGGGLHEYMEQIRAELKKIGYAN